MRYIMYFAGSIIVAAAFAVTTGIPRAQPSPRCILNLSLGPSDCARLLRSQRQSPPDSTPFTSNSPLLYAAEPFQAAIAVFTIGDNGLKSDGHITLPAGSAPTGLAVDSSQNVYAAVASFTNATFARVYVFSHGGTHPIRTYVTGLTAPVGVAIDKSGTVYVANLVNANGAGCSSMQDSNVVEYARGSTKPTTILQGIPGCIHAVAVDAKSNVYASYIEYYVSTGSTSGILKYEPHEKKGEFLHLAFAAQPNLYAMAFDPTGNFLVANSTDDDMLQQILMFSPNQREPRRIIQYGGLWDPKYFTLWNGRIFTTAYIAEPVGQAVGEFAYPTGQQLWAQNPPGFRYYGFTVSDVPKKGSK